MEPAGAAGGGWIEGRTGAIPITIPVAQRQKNHLGSTDCSNLDQMLLDIVQDAGRALSNREDSQATGGSILRDGPSS